MTARGEPQVVKQARHLSPSGVFMVTGKAF